MIIVTGKTVLRSAPLIELEAISNRLVSMLATNSAFYNEELDDDLASLRDEVIYAATTIADIVDAYVSEEEIHLDNLRRWGRVRSRMSHGHRQSRRPIRAKRGKSAQKSSEPWVCKWNGSDATELMF